jgi:MFS family permease
MTGRSAAGLRLRAGQLFCDCFGEAPPTFGANWDGDRSLVKMAAAAGLSILSQVLAISTIPVASAELAPNPSWFGAPYAAMLTGGLLATFPASFLMDIFGRRAAFALGASLGLAGGLIAAWGIAWGQFVGLVLGSFWLGVAQGFGLFYRHAAALGNGSRAIGWVLGSGCLAGLTAPTLIVLVQWETGPLAAAAIVFLAGLASLATLAYAVRLPEVPTEQIRRPPLKIRRRDLVFATACGALAWFVMTALMGSAPILMVGCGVAAAAASTPIAWHVLAMYLPAALATPAIESIGGVRLCLVGLVITGVGAALVFTRATLLGFSLALIVAGCGWSLATLGATIWLHKGAAPSRGVLAGHDFCLFAAAIGGALFSGFSA